MDGWMDGGTVDGRLDGRLDGREADGSGTVEKRTVMEAGRDGHGTVTVSGQKRKIYCKKASKLNTSTRGK